MSLGNCCGQGKGDLIGSNLDENEDEDEDDDDEEEDERNSQAGSGHHPSSQCLVLSMRKHRMQGESKDRRQGSEILQILPDPPFP